MFRNFPDICSTYVVEYTYVKTLSDISSRFAEVKYLFMTQYEISLNCNANKWIQMLCLIFRNEYNVKFFSQYFKFR